MKEKTTSFLVRLNNSDVAEMINEIERAGIYKSKNELINKILEYGVPEVYERVFGKRKNTKSVTGNNGAEVVLEQLSEIGARQKKEGKEHDELFALMTIIEFLTTTLVNIEIAKSEGVTVAKSDIENGLYASLPEKLERLKNEISGRLS